MALAQIFRQVMVTVAKASPTPASPSTLTSAIFLACVCLRHHLFLRAISQPSTKLCCVSRCYSLQHLFAWMAVGNNQKLGCPAESPTSRRHCTLGHCLAPSIRCLVAVALGAPANDRSWNSRLCLAPQTSRNHLSPKRCKPIYARFAHGWLPVLRASK